MFHLDRPMYLLGYLAHQSRVYLIDKEFKWALNLSGIELADTLWLPTFSENLFLAVL